MLWRCVFIAVLTHLLVIIACYEVTPSKALCEKDDEIEYLCMPDCKNTCKNHNISYPICPAACITGCFCKPGLVKRESDGKCVSPDQCEYRDPCPDKDEVDYVCKPDCKNTCRNFNNPYAVCTAVCVPGCFCRSGLVKRESDGKCVKPGDCYRVPCTNENEVEYFCKPDCKNTCRNYINPRAVCPTWCKAGCFCRPGLLKRESDGKCVPPYQCDRAQCPNPDEVEYICKPDCKNTCQNYPNPNAVCPAICSHGCFCKPGMVKRESDGQCVLPDQCDIRVSCPVYEEYSSCIIPCNDCNIRGKCKSFECKKGCDCQQGYFRDQSGNCILEEKCPVQCPVYEEYSNCIVPCNDCKTRGKCSFLVCNKGCDCVKGYYRDHTGKCITEEQCPVQCPANEEFSNCVIPCNDCKTKGRCKFVKCNKGCDCMKGYYRDSAARCIPEDQCPASCPDENEVEYVCKPNCKNTCKNHNNPITVCLAICEGGCFCKPGLVKRERDGQCVTPDQCPPTIKCPKDEEYYDCGPTCNHTCTSYGKNYRCPEICRPGCFCKKGYVLNSRGKCVYPDQCRNDLCRSDEDYFDCAPICNTCGNHNQTNVYCPAICKIGCFCKLGTLLRDDGRCVLPQLCPPREPVYPIYPPSSYLPGISYRKLDTNASESTVPPENVKASETVKESLSPVTGRRKEIVDEEKESSKITESQQKRHSCARNESYYTCAPLCMACENLNRTNVVCPAVCWTGCFCQRGFLKRNDGNCVMPEDCPPKPLENFEPLPISEDTNPPDSVNPYDPAYDSSDDAYRQEFEENEDMEEVDPRRGRACRQGERYYHTCRSPCEATCAEPRGPRFCNLSCAYGCFCREGLLRREDGKCVRQSQCF